MSRDDDDRERADEQMAKTGGEPKRTARAAGGKSRARRSRGALQVAAPVGVPAGATKAGLAGAAAAPAIARPHLPSSEPEDDGLGGGSLLNWASDLVSALASGGFDVSAPRFLRELDREVGERIARAPMELNGYGYDPWGFHTEVTRRALVAAGLLYRYYFRVETQGIENLPEGRVLLISNHAGQIALDAAMIGVACTLEGEPPRIVRGMGEYWLPTLPFVNVLMVRTGSVVGTPKNAVDLLHHGEAVIAFPEGVRGMNKSFSERYKLMEFGKGFMRLALQTGTPIVPIAVVGSEEQAPSLGSFKPLARLLGMPAFPLLLVPFPLPVRYRIFFGEPMEFRGNPNDEDALIEEKVELVKGRIRSMLERGLRQRRSIFF
jgi:1-acyl-sn-glycerol-3-phosphate acyltransferase